MPNLDQFAVILFTLRDHLKTRKDAERSFDRIAEIGYKSIQISGMDPTLFVEEELVEMAHERGLTICATHEPGDQIRQHPEQVIQRLHKLGVKYTAYPMPKDVEMTDPDSVSELIADLNAAGRLFSEAGLVLCYHNHHHEFIHNNGKTVLARIYDETEPAYLQGELDTFWVQAGGGCIESWIRKLNGRLPLLHIKDFKLNAEREREFAEIGNGNLDFPTIIKTAEAAGCRYFIVEQDRCSGDPFDSIAQSLAYIKANLVD